MHARQLAAAASGDRLWISTMAGGWRARAAWRGLHPQRQPVRLLASAALAAALAALPAAAREPIVLRFSHVVAVDTPKGRAADLFKRRAEELTDGRVRVDVFPDGTLYTDRDEIQALQLGAVQMLAPSLSKFGPLGETEFEVFDLPFLFAGEADVRRVTEGAVGRRLLEKLEAKGIRGLAYWDNGFKSFSANRPLHAPADYRGVRMRIQASMVLDAQMRALGALPQMMAFSDVHEALRTGAVDGTENPISNFWSQRMHEVQRHLALTRHGYLGYAVVANKRFWDGLPSDVRRGLERALAEATAHANALAREKDAQDLERVLAAGTTEVYAPTPEERLALKKALAGVHRQMEARIGKRLVDEIHAAVRFDPDRL